MPMATEESTKTLSIPRSECRVPITTTGTTVSASAWRRAGVTRSGEMIRPSPAPMLSERTSSTVWSGRRPVADTLSRIVSPSSSSIARSICT